jgi:ABC-type cobalamin/Fe3+-siderophores transport system ATPase subunit
VVVFTQAAIGVSLLAFGGFTWALDGASAPVAAVLRLEGAMAAAGRLPAVRTAAHMPARDIRFRDVSFAYPGGASVLEHFDLTIPAGSSIAIVGQNGAGKTTLAKLLCRLYDPQSGAIEVDGIDVRDIDVGAWRARLTAVFQDFIRLELPLRDNVAPSGASDEVVRAALESAGATNLAPLDTILARGYTGGTDLSGGQWQRVALARAGAVSSAPGRAARRPTAQLDVPARPGFWRILAARASARRSSSRIDFDGSSGRSHLRARARPRGGARHPLRADALATVSDDVRCRPAGSTAEDEAEKYDVSPEMPRDEFRRALVDVAAVQARLPPRAGADARLVHPVVASAQTRSSPSAAAGRGVSAIGPGWCSPRISLGVSATATWFLRTVSTVAAAVSRQVTIALGRTPGLVASIRRSRITGGPSTSIAFRCFGTRCSCSTTCMSVFSTAGWILRLAVTIALLASIHPALVLLAAFALPTVLTSTWRPGVERSAQEQGAQSSRLARHLFTTATTAPPGKEVRVLGIGRRLAAQRREAWESGTGLSPRRAGIRRVAHAGVSIRRCLCRRHRVRGHACPLRPATSCSCSPPARGCRYIGATVGEIGFLRGVWMDGSRLAGSRTTRRRSPRAQDRPCPPPFERDSLRSRVVQLSGTSRVVLDDVSLTLPAGAVVAIVGENGAGKTTLVKLLAKMHEPSGRFWWTDAAGPHEG